MPRVHLGNHQGYGGSMSDTVESHLPNARGDVLEVGHQHVAPSVQGVSRVIRRQLECLQLLRQSYDKEKRL